jgi:hypothetical protein
MLSINRHMRWLYLPLFVVLSGCGAETKENVGSQEKQTQAGVAQERNRGATELFEEYFRKYSEVRRNNGLSVVEYCPDNKCYEYSGRAQSDERLFSFVALYSYYISQHYSLCDFRHGAAKAVHELLKKEGAACSSSNEVEQVKCTLSLLAKENAIRVSYVTYDEKDRHEEKVDLKKELENVGKPNYGPALCK